MRGAKIRIHWTGMDPPGSALIPRPSRRAVLEAREAAVQNAAEDFLADLFPPTFACGYRLGFAHFILRRMAQVQMMHHNPRAPFPEPRSLSACRRTDRMKMEPGSLEVIAMSNLYPFPTGGRPKRSLPAGPREIGRRRSLSPARCCESDAGSCCEPLTAGSSAAAPPPGGPGLKKLRELQGRP